jgi:hypothetical protein
LNTISEGIDDGRAEVDGELRELTAEGLPKLRCRKCQPMIALVVVVVELELSHFGTIKPGLDRRVKEFLVH